MLRLLKRAAAGDTEIALLLMALAGYGDEVDRVLTGESASAILSENPEDI